MSDEDEDEDDGNEDDRDWWAVGVACAPSQLRTNEWANQFLLPRGTRSAPRPRRQRRRRCLNLIPTRTRRLPPTQLLSLLPRLHQASSSTALSVFLLRKQNWRTGCCGENGRKSEDGQRERESGVAEAGSSRGAGAGGEFAFDPAFDGMLARSITWPSNCLALPSLLLSSLTSRSSVAFSALCSRSCFFLLIRFVF